MPKKEEIHLDQTELIAAVKRVAVETGSLVCLGCGYEYHCGIRGCRILQAVVAMLEANEDRGEHSGVLSEL